MKRARRFLLALLRATLLAVALGSLGFVLTAASLVTLQKGWRVYNARPTQVLIAAAIAAWLGFRLRPSGETRAWLRGTPRGRACLAAGAIALAGPLAWAWACMIHMPGASHSGPLDPLTPAEESLRDALRRDVSELAERIGMRNLVHYEALERAADFLEGSMRKAGYAVRRRSFTAFGRDFHNLEAELPGSAKPDEVLVVGAHYDSAEGAPGADDNATGAAAVLALARAFAGRPAARTLRFVEFANEEPPHFKGPSMGSLTYARECAARGDRIVAMLSLETLGYYSDLMGTQAYPFPLGLCYPSTGDFIAFAGDTASAPLVRRSLGAFRAHARFPSQGAAVPALLPGIDWSDHWSFGQVGYPAVMVTDTAPFRNPHYHRGTDTVEWLDFDRLARVVGGLEATVRALADEP